MTTRAPQRKIDNWTTPPEIKTERSVLVEFLEVLAQGKSVAETCRILGLARTTLYQIRRKDPVFREAWFQAEAIGVDVFYNEVHDTARAMGVGQWSSRPILDAEGEQVLDADFNPVMEDYLDTSNVVSSILGKLMDKTMASVDPIGTTVNVLAGTAAPVGTGHKLIDGTTIDNTELDRLSILMDEAEE